VGRSSVRLRELHRVRDRVLPTILQRNAIDASDTNDVVCGAADNPPASAMRYVQLHQAAGSLCHILVGYGDQITRAVLAKELAVQIGVISGFELDTESYRSTPRR
jgi:hypothetical protein